MSDKILLFLIVLGLSFGSYRLITKLREPKPAETPEQVVTPEPAKAAPPAPPAPVVAEKPPEPKEIVPARLSDQKMGELFRVSGIATGIQGSMVIINNTSLQEGDELGELRIDKILDDYAEVSYQGNIYQLAPHYLQAQIN